MIEIHEVSKSYGTHQALSKVSFQVPKGEIFGLVGLNGAGKSTLARILMGLLKADEGRVEIEGTEVKSDPVLARSKIGFLPEESVLYNDLTALEHLEIVADLRGLDPQSTALQARKILDFLELDQARERPVRTYSKGMRRKTALAMALLGDPPALLFDEPTSGLDPDGALRFSEILSELARQGRAIIVNSHILPEIEQRCARFGVLEAGKIVALGTLEDLRKKADLPAARLEDLFLHFTGRTRRDARGLFDRGQSETETANDGERQ